MRRILVFVFLLSFSGVFSVISDTSDNNPLDPTTAEDTTVEEVLNQIESKERGDVGSALSSSVPPSLLINRALTEGRVRQRLTQAQRRAQQAEKEIRLSAHISQVAEEFRQIDIGPRFATDLHLGYTSEGVDAVVPEYFHQGDIFSQKFSFYPPSEPRFRVSVENLISVDGGFFSDAGDQTIVSVEASRTFKKVFGTLKHRWLHANYTANDVMRGQGELTQSGESFFYADRHRTDLQVGTSFLGLVKPYAILSTDISTIPVDEFTLYGGAGLDVRYSPHPRINLYAGGSIMRAFLWRRAAYRIHTGVVLSVGGFDFDVGFGVLQDLFYEGTIFMPVISCTH